MQIPQTWIGIAERRRPDFVAFVPLQFWKYRWLAIQLDAAHGQEQIDDDWLRDQYIQEHNFEVISLRPKEKGYFEEVRSLVETIESWMNLATRDPWSVAVECKVKRSYIEDDLPF
jgi:hypothetical protein